MVRGNREQCALRLLSTAAGFYVCAKRIIVGHCPHRLRRAQHCLPLGNLVLCKKRCSRGARNDVDRKQSNEVVSCDTNTKKEYPKGYSFFGAGDRDRTGTGIATHGILSPGRLPVPPHRHVRFLIARFQNKSNFNTLAGVCQSISRRFISSILVQRLVFSSISARKPLTI